MAHFSSSIALGSIIRSSQSEQVSGPASASLVVVLGLASACEVNMKREQAHIGMLVVFGMPGEEQTLAKIVVVNPVRAKVEALEPRAGRPVGTRFNVPFHLMRPAENQQPPATEEVESQSWKMKNSG